MVARRVVGGAMMSGTIIGGATAIERVIPSLRPKTTVGGNARRGKSSIFEAKVPREPVTSMAAVVRVGRREATLAGVVAAAVEPILASGGEVDDGVHVDDDGVGQSGGRPLREKAQRLALSLDGGGGSEIP